MRARLQQVAVEHRVAGVGGGDHDVRIVDHVLGTPHGAGLDAVAFGHFPGEALPVLLPQREHLDLPDLPHRAKGRHLAVCLGAAAEDAQHRRVLPRQVLRRHPAGGPDPERRQVVVVDDALEGPFLDAEEHDEAGEVAGELHAARAVHVSEPDLGRIEPHRGRIEGRHRPGNDVQPVPGALQALLRHVQPAPGHTLGDLPAKLSVRRFHRIHDLPHVEETLHVLVGQDQHVLVSHHDPPAGVVPESPPANIERPIRRDLSFQFSNLR